MSLRHHARGIAEHPISALERRRRWAPATHHAGREQLGGCRLMAPDGDRRHGAQSRGIKDEINLLAILHDDIVRVFVLRDYLGHRTGWLVTSGPRQDVRQRALLAQHWLELRDGARRLLVLRRDRNDTHSIPTENSVEA